VRAISRSEKSDDLIRTLGAAPVRCDLEDVAENLTGRDVVIHAVAYVEPWGLSDRGFTQPGSKPEVSTFPGSASAQ
jgi:hypothetical protein